jgi:hypothetical protein
MHPGDDPVTLRRDHVAFQGRDVHVQFPFEGAVRIPRSTTVSDNARHLLVRKLHRIDQYLLTVFHSRTPSDDDRKSFQPER